MFGQDLLPSNATPFERALSLAMDIRARLGAAPESSKGLIYQLPLPEGWEKTAVYTLGLEMLDAFLIEPALLMERGPQFMRERGTVKALYDGLDLVGYNGNLFEARPTKRLWNRFQVGLYRIPDNETPDLERISGVTELAAAERSKFHRGWYGYNVEAGETSYSKTSRCLTSGSSGVSVRPGGPRWSFGRPHDFDHVLPPSDLQNLGAWIVPDAGPWTWAMMTFPWRFAVFPWNATVNDTRLAVMGGILSSMSAWVEFRRQDGSVIGSRRARVRAMVEPNANGPIVFGANRYSQVTDPRETYYVEALTDFDQATGETAKSAALRLGAFPTNSETPGILWASPGQLTTPYPAVAVRPVDITFRRTVRERIRTLLRITS